MEAAMGESTEDAVESSNSCTSAGDCRSDVRLNGEINGSCEDNVDMCQVISRESAPSKLLSDVGGDSNHSVLSNSVLVEENGNAHNSDSDGEETMDVHSDNSNNRIEGECEEFAMEGEVMEDCGSSVGVDDEGPEPFDPSVPSPTMEDSVKVGTAETCGEVGMDDSQGSETDVAGMGDDSQEASAALREDVSQETGTALRDSEEPSIAGESDMQLTDTLRSELQETDGASGDDSQEASSTAERDVSPETVHKDTDTDKLDNFDIENDDVEENGAISKTACDSSEDMDQPVDAVSDVGATICSGDEDKEGAVSHEDVKPVCKSTDDDVDNVNEMDTSAAEEGSTTVKMKVSPDNDDVDNVNEMDASAAAAADEDSTTVKIQQSASTSDKPDNKLEDTPGKIKKPRKSSTPLNVTPRRSSRNLSKTQKLYSEQEEDPDIEEITPQDPLADPLSGDVIREKESSKPRVARNKTTIVVNDTKRLVEIAAGSKPSKGGKKEPTLVIIDTNSILSGRGPIPVSQSVQSSSNSPAPGYSMLPMALPAQGLYPSSVTPSASPTVMPNPLRTSTPIATISQSRPPPQILPSLTDDMYVVEAPSFIVPYVYEKPPIKPLKEYVEGMAKEIEKLKEELKASDANDTNVSEQEKSEKADTSKDAGGDKPVLAKEDIEKHDDEKTSHTNSGETKRLSEEDIVANGEDTAHSTPKDSSESSKQTKKVDSEELKNEVKSTDVNGDISQETDRKEESKVDDKEKELTKAEPTKPLTYFDNPLGKFFMQIGVNLVQEFVQTDLLRSQKKKRDREGGRGASVTQFAISSLLKNLELSKENNEPFHLNLKKCEYCNFKTESALVMAQHLETPHMKNYVYRCNFCTLEVRSPHDILFHMEAEHNVRGRLERAPAFHQCPNCPFEDNQKGKLSRHLISCLKKFKPEKNQEPPLDWEPPAKIPRVSRNRPATMGIAYQALSGKQVPQHPLLPKLVPSPQMSSSASSSGGRGRGRPPLHSRFLGDVGKIPVQRPIAPTQIRQSMLYRSTASGSPMLVPTTYQISGNQIYQGQMMPVMSSGITPVPRIALMPSGSSPSQSASSSSASANTPTPVALVPSNAITIQNAHKNNPTAKLLQQPSISITPLPRQPATMTPPNSGLKQATTSSGGKATFVICEICDGYIKDLEQLRNHMQWIHKVKIHPKMIYNRPPLNCQKCQFRFFTDQGLERHLLGSHGLVTSSMQEAANKGKDGGRCPVCGRVYQWKLLNHVARDHNMTLKPAHLSYKCTVCTATFGMYKQFENHVYSAHSVVAKRVMDKKTTSPNQQPQRPQGATGDSLLKPLKINDEITIIPQPARPRPGPASRTGAISAAAQAASSAKVWQCDDCEATFDGPTGFAQFTAHVKRRHLRRCSVRLCRLDACPTCKRRHVTGSVLEWLRERSGVDVIELSDDEVVIGQGRSEITITKVSCAPGPKRFKQRLQQAKVQVIEIEDSPIKASASEENGEDSLTAVKERLRRRKSLEISQIDSDGSPQVAEDLPSKKRRKIGDD